MNAFGQLMRPLLRSRTMDRDSDLNAELERMRAECERLQRENAELRVRLGEGSTDVIPAPQESSPVPRRSPEPSVAVTAISRPELKVSLFRSLFRGRDDVYAARWEGRNGRSGY